MRQNVMELVRRSDNCPSIGSAPRVSRPHRAERSEGSLRHAQAIPENDRNGAPEIWDMALCWRFASLMVGPWIARVNAALAFARRFAALTRALRRPKPH